MDVGAWKREGGVRMASNLPSGAARASEGSHEPTLAVSGLTKSYIGVRALRDMTLTFASGDAHAIAGRMARVSRL